MLFRSHAEYGLTGHKGMAVSRFLDAVALLEAEVDWSGDDSLVKGIKFRRIDGSDGSSI